MYQGCNSHSLHCPRQCSTAHLHCRLVDLLCTAGRPQQQPPIERPVASRRWLHSHSSLRLLSLPSSSVSSSSFTHHLLASPAASGTPLQQTHPTLRTASPQWQMGGGSAQTGMGESLTNLSVCSTGTGSTVHARCSPVACARVGLKPSCAHVLAAHTPTPSCAHAACFLPAHPPGCCRKEGPPPHIAVWNESDTLKHGNEVGCVCQPCSHQRPSHWGGVHLPSARSAPLAPRHCPAAPVPRGPMACIRRLRRPALDTRQLGAWAAKQGSWSNLCTQLRRPSPPAGLGCLEELPSV